MDSTEECIQNSEKTAYLGTVTSVQVGPIYTWVQYHPHRRALHMHTWVQYQRHMHVGLIYNWVL